METPNETPKPNKVHEALFGQVKLEVCQFEGKNGPFLKGKIVRIFTDNDGDWKETNYYGERDAQNLALAAAELNNYIQANSQPASEEAAA